jgi:hydrogenase-4 membrane subunit HyfE
MRWPLMLFLLATIVPVFFGKVRAAPLWLAVQAVALAWAGLIHHAEWSWHTLFGVLEVLLVRGVLAPLLLYRAIRLCAQPDSDLMPSNLFSWATGIGLVALAFDFGGAAMADGPALALGVVAATVILVLLILSTNTAPAAQLVAVLFMENAIAVFESMQSAAWPLPVHLMLTGVYLLIVGVGSWLVGRPDSLAAATRQLPPGAGESGA